ncbi:MAG: UDP-N-acetylmuramoyl-L-alanine--D-glutamate ligase [Actinobacteria bacterium]|nr:UDP-N-acetylmuramoyl-L-alanine--D-glutamate ligase [Actinomycetota bacterium]
MDRLGPDSDAGGLHVTVAGIRLAGSACARALRGLGAEVVAVDAGNSPDHQRWAEELRALGVVVELGDGTRLPQPTDLLVVSPGFPPGAPIVRAALDAGVPVWGELELAWRLRGPGAAPWLVITGTNGKTTTTLMLESMLQAAGLRALAAANIGVSLVDAVLGPPLDAIAVEVGAPQLPFWHTPSPLASVCLNVAPDHVDHFGSYEEYRAAKAKIYARTQVAAVFNTADPATERMVRDAEVVEGCRAIGFTLGVPGLSELGVVEEFLVDRAFVENRATHAQELALVSDVEPAAPHNVANALAAAALARAFGLEPAPIQQGLRNFRPAGHRIARVGTVAGVDYVDDSKATNAHAAGTSLRAYERVVWIAGGLAKGQEFDELVVEHASRLRAVVLLGADRARIRSALARHAPQIPIYEVSDTDTEAMAEVVAAAADLAEPGDTVLLAPGCASWDMFDNYSQRGAIFAEQVDRLAP